MRRVSIRLHKFHMSSATILAFLVLTLIFCSREVASSSSISVSSPFEFRSRSILRSIDDSKGRKTDYGVELNATDFDSVLRETSAAHAIVEFYAHWCPACRNYKPHYEKIAKIFNGVDAIHPGIILVTRVDCALKINTDLCDKFTVQHYPMLLWGPPFKFVSGSWDPKEEKSEIHSITDARTADLLLNWINRQLNSSYHLEDEKYENDQLPKNYSDIGQIEHAIHDIEEATSTALEIILDHKMIKSENRASLVKFFQLLVAHHPSRRCRKGSAEILVDFDDFSANKNETASVGEKRALRNYNICGQDVPRGYWMFCRGSKNETRGFSCGLWILLHSLSVRVDDAESQLAFATICHFIHNFFICEECRQHFYSMCSSVSSPFQKARDFVLWLWNAHNQVNERLTKEATSLGTADPEFPKVIWPPRQLCPSCYLSRSGNSGGTRQIDWNHDEVHRFLIVYYGTITSPHNDTQLLVEKQTDSVVFEDLTASAKSSEAVVVPVGAAFAIAVASCAFGALSCYWRQRQKSRKYKSHLHSLKSI